MWAAFILLICSLPGQDLPNIDFWAIDIEDKIGHLIVFGFLGFLIYRGGSRSKGFNRRRLFIITCLLGISYGAFTEILQGLAFPSRYASLSDFIADALGVILGTVIARFFFHNR
jgi:VanZ family protein